MSADISYHAVPNVLRGRFRHSHVDFSTASIANHQRAFSRIKRGGGVRARNGTRVCAVRANVAVNSALFGRGEIDVKARIVRIGDGGHATVVSIVGVKVVAAGEAIFDLCEGNARVRIDHVVGGTGSVYGGNGGCHGGGGSGCDLDRRRMRSA